MHAESKSELHGNDRYQGYIIDLIKELANLLRFKYRIHLVGDGKYGSFNETTGRWEGMIGELIDDKADIAIVDFTITSSREKVVDFTYPFMSTGISILYEKPTTKETSLWSFLDPFSIIVWVYLVGSFVGVSIILFLSGRFSPYEWDNPYPCRQNNQILENIFSLANSFWCTGGSLMQQGSDIAPKYVLITFIKSQNQLIFKIIF